MKKSFVFAILVVLCATHGTPYRLYTPSGPREIPPRPSAPRDPSPIFRSVSQSATAKTYAYAIFNGVASTPLLPFFAFSAGVKIWTPLEAISVQPHKRDLGATSRTQVAHSITQKIYAWAVFNRVLNQPTRKNFEMTMGVRFLGVHDVLLQWPKFQTLQDIELA